MSDSFATPRTVALQAPLSREFSGQECWSGLPFSSPGDLPDPGIEPGSPELRADSLPSEPPGKPYGLAQAGAVCCEWVERETEEQAADLFVVVGFPRKLT